jgi:hypothetical protein
MSTAKTATVREIKGLAEVPDPVEDRLQILAEMLVYGASREEILDQAQRRWGVSRRTAQDYLHTVRQRLTGEAAEDDRLFALRLSQLQRDKLVGLALRYTLSTKEEFDPKVLQSLAAMITAVRGLLDSRDRTAAEIHQLVAEQICKTESAAPPRPDPASGDEARPPAAADGHNRTATPSANGKSRLPHQRNGNAAAPKPPRPATSTSVLHADRRPPLPTDDFGVDLIDSPRVPKLQTSQEIGSVSRENEQMEATCAACAGGP